MPSVFSQLEVKITHRPSGDTLGRGSYQKYGLSGLLSLPMLLEDAARRFDLDLKDQNQLRRLFHA